MTPPNGYEEIVNFYGNPDPFRDPRAQMLWAHRILAPVIPPFEMRYIGKPVQSIWVHRKLTREFADVLKAIKDMKLDGLVKDYAGAYSFRAKRTNPDEFSIHTWAAAIDLNTIANPLGSSGTAEQHQLNAVFATHGWTWGGDFRGTKDPMHWQFATGD